MIEQAINIQPDKPLFRNNAATVLVEMRRGSVTDALEGWVVNQPAVQVLCALTAVVAAVAAVAQRDDTVVVWRDR